MALLYQTICWVFTMIHANVISFTSAMPAKLIDAVGCILEDVAEKVRVFGVTRRTKVPYVSYVNKAGKVVSGFLKREILSKFKGNHFGFKNRCFIITQLETGEQTIIKLNVGDMVEVVGDRYNKQFIWQQGKVLNISSDGWISVRIDHKLLQFRGEELDPISTNAEKTPAQLNEQAVQIVNSSPHSGCSKASNKYVSRVDWSKEPDEILFAAAELAKRDLGF